MPYMLRNVFEKLAEQTTAVVYIFNATLEARFVELFRGINKHRDDSSAAMVDFISYGPVGPWKTLFKGLADDVARD
jgi:hypothetical protein